MHFEGRQRVTIQNIEPEIDAGEFPIKRVEGEEVVVRASVFSDGHDLVKANLLYRSTDDHDFTSVAMKPRGNDVFEGRFVAESRSGYIYTVEGQVDRFGTWQTDLRKKLGAGLDISVELQIGAAMVKEAAGRASGEDARALNRYESLLADVDNLEDATSSALGTDLPRLMDLHPDRQFVSRYGRELQVDVDRPRAGFSTWYELFPRSFGTTPGEHGTFRDAERMLPRLARMGFDVVYLPPIHPIGLTNRKGKNNSVKAEPEDPGSPWAIGAATGGHKAVHPELGTLDDFKHFVQEAKKHDLEVALDIAFQCSPDHPWVKQHPEWFLWRPDGSIQFAENPPKKYEDIVPLNFETDAWQELWQELKSVFLFWAEKGVQIFRVDNPHTKPFPFWQWVISEIRKDHPDTIFLSEAFTRPQVAGRLAKIGFSQSYTYFTWRNSKHELTEYLTQLITSPVRDYFRPNFWPNTPDILPEYLQYGGRPAFLIRLCLAATLSSNYGMYGPAFELCVGEALEGREEYLNSEKYELKSWDLDKKGNIGEFITLINQIRRDNPALQRTANLRFLEVDNDYLLFYAKVSEDLSNVLLVLVNLDPFHKQSGWVNVPLEQLDMDPSQPYLVYDLVGDDKFIWQGERNYVELDPRVLPFHIFRVHRRLRRETDFDYYL